MKGEGINQKSEMQNTDTGDSAVRATGEGVRQRGGGMGTERDFARRVGAPCSVQLTDLYT